MPHRRTSIILVADTGLDEIASCVASLQEHTPAGSYELIVVSPDTDGEVSAWLSRRSGIVLVKHDGPLGGAAALNQGIRAAHCDNVLLLNARVTVTAGYLPILLTALHSDASVGAVGPATNNIPGQSVPAACQTIEQLAEMAAHFNSSDATRWDKRLCLSGACLLLKRAALADAGLFDECYAFSTLRDDDFSFRLISSGWTLLYARDVFVHYAGHPLDSFRAEEFGTQRERFMATWGFDPTYSTIQRSEVVALLDPHPPDAHLRVLELGCGCGATLLEIKNRFRNSETYGIELNEGAVSIGRRFADIRTLDAAQPLEYPGTFFDYVITADVLEHLIDPWGVVANIRPHLKESGKVLASIPNVMHVSVMRGLLNGRFSYQDAGILDRTHLRFFTLTEIDSLFAGAGYGSRSYSATTVPLADDDVQLVNSLKSLSTTNTSDQFQAYQYLVKVAK